MKKSQKLGIIQAVLQTLNIKFHGIKIGAIIYSVFYHVSEGEQCDQIMRWWSYKPQSVTAQTLYSAAFLQLHFYPALLPHNFFYLFLDHLFCFSLPLLIDRCW